ncbi:MAG: hypothetical protein WDZ41_04070 [Candidatus Babeliales bacterium]
MENQLKEILESAKILNDEFEYKIFSPKEYLEEKENIDDFIILKTEVIKKNK